MKIVEERKLRRRVNQKRACKKKNVLVVGALDILSVIVEIVRVVERRV